jgi:hypothetical protein
LLRISGKSWDRYPMMTLLGIVGVIVIGAFVYQLSRSVLFGLYCLLAVSFVNVALGLSQITIGGLHLDAVDLVSISLLVAGGIRFSNRVMMPGTTRLIVLAYLVIFSVSLFRGVTLFGIQSASNEARGFVGSILAMLYFFTAPTDPIAIRKILIAYLYFGVGLVIIAILHYAGLNVGTAVLDEKDRALPSASGEIIALCFFMGLGWITHRRKTRILRWLLPVFAGMAILLQHRTVWTVMAICCIAILFIDFKLVRRLIPLAALASIVAIGLAIAIYGTSGEASTQFEDSATNEGTWNWRVEAWRNSIFDDTQTVPMMIFGQPMGSAYVRFVSSSGQYENLPPHSEYVSQYLRVGILGLPIFLAFLFRPLLMLCQLQRKDPLVLFPSVSVWCLVIIGILVYGVTYGYDASAIALVGIANSALLSIKSPQLEGSALVLPIKECAGQDNDLNIKICSVV